MDFHIEQPHFRPFWRDSRHRPTSGIRRYVLVILSLLCLGFILYPPTYGYGEPISMQLACGDIAAWTLFATLGGVLGYTATKLWKSERPYSAIFCGLSVCALGGIAATDPYSGTHLSFFAFLLFMSMGWMWSIQAELEDSKLKACAVSATLGSLVCFLNIGVGERLVLLSMLGGINVLFYDFVLY